MKTGRPLKPLDMSRVKTLYRLGKTVRRIAEIVGLCHTTISRRIAKEWKALGLPSAKAYRQWLRDEYQRLKASIPKKQEVLIKRTSKYTKYIVVGERIHLERR